MRSSAAVSFRRNSRARSTVTGSRLIKPIVFEKGLDANVLNGQIGQPRPSPRPSPRWGEGVLAPLSPTLPPWGEGVGCIGALARHHRSLPAQFQPRAVADSVLRPRLR